MNHVQIGITFPASKSGRRKSWSLTALTLFTACFFTAGCANHSKDVVPAAGPAASGVTAAPTPEQEAAKQHAMQNGAAMDAAREAAAKKAAGGQ